MPDHTVRSPVPGIFYRRPSPGAEPFVELGAEVDADTTIGLVEIMKQYTPVKAGAAGEVTAFSVEEESALGPGDAIAVIATRDGDG